MSRRSYTDVDRLAVLADLEGGLSCRQVGRKHGCSHQTVGRIAREMDHSVDRSATERATRLRRDYAQAERLSVINEAFEAVRRAIPKVAWNETNPRDLVVALGILIDKRRLEDGEATSRGETVTVEDRRQARAEVERVIDELAERRGRKRTE
jgi:hypothetical protein